MELSEHINVFKKHKTSIIIFTLLVGILSFVIGYMKPIDYKATVSLDVNLINRSQTQDYQYGSYYDLKGAEIFTQNIMSWLRTAAIIEDIYRDAEVGYEIKNLDQFTNRFKTRQYAAQNLIVTFYDPSRDNGEKIAHSIGNVVKKKVAESVRDNENNAMFEVVSTTPIVIENKLNLWLVTILGLIVGLVISSLVVYTKYYLKQSK